MRDAVIVSSLRSPVGRASKGSLKDMRPDDLAGIVLQAALAKLPNLDKSLVEDIIIGCAFPEGEQGMNVAKPIGFLGGLPESVGATTVNRFCSSGLQAINMAAQSIVLGQAEVVVAGGVECMSRVPMGGYNPSYNPKLNPKHEFPDVYIPMGLTAENVAKKYGISREDQDVFALRSHQLALAARDQNKISEEIVPITLPNGAVVSTDDGPRRETSKERLSGLEPVFVKGGSVTAGNSSPLNDGAAITILMSADKARDLRITPLARWVTTAVSGVEPEYMGIGPIPAVRKALARAGMTIKDIDIVELNEAFAAQALAVVRELGIDEDKLNPHGGAIAIGHPLGCTGARIMATLLNDLRIYDKRFGLETMCIGGGQGMATIFERWN